jgi:hypothetical protein
MRGCSAKTRKIHTTRRLNRGKRTQQRAQTIGLYDCRNDDVSPGGKSRGSEYKYMTFAEAKELEKLQIQEATSKRLKDFDAKVKEIDGTIPRRSGAWHMARTKLAFSRIEDSVDDRLAIRKAMIERCQALATPHEVVQFEKHESSIIENSFQAVLRNFPVSGVRPPAEAVSGMTTLKLALRHKIHTAVRMMQLEAAHQHASLVPNPVVPPTRPIPQEKREELVTVKPAIWGISLNLNELWRRIRIRFSKKV